MTLAERLTQLNWGGDGYAAYEGRLDRANQNAAKQATGQAQATAANEQGNAAQERSQLEPFYRSEMNAQHLYSPEQTNELLNYAGAANAGTGASAAGEAASEAARTRNTSGFSSALDQNARDRQRAMGNANLGVGQQDILGAKELNQQGAAGMQGLYGTDTNAMLKAMGIQSQDVENQIKAGGWFQNLNEVLGAVGGIAGTLGKLGAGAGG